MRANDDENSLVLTVVSGQEGEPSLIKDSGGPGGGAVAACGDPLARAGGRDGLGALASRPDRGRTGGPGQAGLGPGRGARHTRGPRPQQASRPARVAEALACGATALLPADRIDDHFLSVLRMVGQGYLRRRLGTDAAADRRRARPLGGRRPGGLEIPELTARESDILRSLAQGHVDPADRPGPGDSAEDGGERPDPAVPEAWRPQPIRSVRRCRRIRPAACECWAPGAGTPGAGRPPRGIRRYPEMSRGLSFIGGE